MAVLSTIGDGLWAAFQMAWEVWWALVLGFALSGIVQAWVPRARIERALGGRGPKQLAVATDSHVYEKVVSNIQEVRARGAHVIAIATDGNEDIQHHADDVIFVPRSPAFLQAVLAALPLQLLAYRIARLRGLNVDQPRNLAKTVTVE